MRGVQAERSAAEAALQEGAQRHHRQVMVRSLWEALGAAVALRRAADQMAHRHSCQSSQRQVSSCHLTSYNSVKYV